LDTAIRFSSASDENSAAQIAELSNALIKLKVAGARAVVCLHHSTKRAKREGMSITGSLRGSGDFAASADIILSLDKEEPPEGMANLVGWEDRLRIKMRFEKDREAIPTQSMITIQGRPFLDEKGQLMIIDLSDETKQEEMVKVLKYIKAKPEANHAEVAKAVQIAKSKVGTYTRELGWTKVDGKWQKNKGSMDSSTSD